MHEEMRQMLDFDALRIKQEHIAVIGLGYVGLPLAVALGKRFQVLGFDVSPKRVEELRSGYDRTGEVEAESLKQSQVRFSSRQEDLAACRLLIVAVPTPIDENHRPDLDPILAASRTVGRNMVPGSIVVYESTVYPGLTEEVCQPILESESGLACGRDFWLGYSPERINPGDKVNTLASIVKVVAGQNQQVTDLLAQVYSSVVEAGVHKASSIKVAEAAKVIENTQRDLNIALMNELALIFQRLDIDTLEVLEAAGTKWNFLPFKPGLVGGHCIGVDPYYLTFKAEALDYHPQVILAGRRINDSMGEYVAQTVVKRLIQAGCTISGARVGVLGLTFKENVPDLRNTRVVDIVQELKSFCLDVLVHDPLVDGDEVRRELGMEPVGWDALQDLEAIVLAVPHAAFGQYGLDGLISRFRDPARALLADVKGLFDPEAVQSRGIAYWRL
jgi:UDP-N-acetyl-D-galactosamine dehydrogenase